MLKILIGLDYELFLGENYYDSNEILFNPTYRIVNMLEEKGITATLFADVCCALQHKKYRQVSFVENFEKQLVDVNHSGFDVQLHIHPNWLNSTFEDGKMNISAKGYRLHDFGFGDFAGGGCCFNS